MEGRERRAWQRGRERDEGCEREREKGRGDEREKRKKKPFSRDFGNSYYVPHSI